MQLEKTKIASEKLPVVADVEPYARPLEQTVVLPQVTAVNAAWRALLFLLIGTALVHLLAYAADSLAPDGNTRFLKADQQHVADILARAAQIDALAVGNSHAGSINMAALGYENGYRFPRPDGDLIEVQHYLEALTPRLPQLKAVFIPISYFAFVEDNAAAAEVEIRRAHTYASLPSWRFVPGDFANFVRGKGQVYLPITRLMREDNWSGVVYAALGEPPEEKGFTEVAADDCSFLDAASLADSAQNRVTKYQRLTEEMTAGQPELAAANTAVILNIHTMLQRQGIRVVFFTPPYAALYNKLYQQENPAMIAHMRDTMTRLVQENGLEYYDFSQDETFSQQAHLFKDSDHLNGCGARLFSEKFGQLLTTPSIH